jgi:hypothetical protein
MLSSAWKRSKLTDTFATADGSIPAPPEEQEYALADVGCGEVTLVVTVLVHNKETDYVVARFALDSPYWIDPASAANGIWSLALPRYELLLLLCTLLRSQFMTVILRREELLA